MCPVHVPWITLKHFPAGQWWSLKLPTRAAKMPCAHPFAYVEQCRTGQGGCRRCCKAAKPASRSWQVQMWLRQIRQLRNSDKLVTYQSNWMCPVLLLTLEQLSTGQGSQRRWCKAQQSCQASFQEVGRCCRWGQGSQGSWETATSPAGDADDGWQCTTRLGQNR